MTKKILGVLLLTFVLGTGVCFAEAEIPNLVGTWTTQSEAALLSKAGGTGEWTHHSQEFSTLSAELVVTKQQGRVIYATFTSKMASEQMAGVIGWDNKTLYLVDQDGFTDATIVSKDKITCIYRHVGEKDAVAAVGVWTRKK
ncbi:MAG: hypothetical protein RIN56_03070 [Sporomusaceae bacterium]|nr:hypothetical protein [Sporomusaceae bacterium]